jgi:hypothetical protein
MSQAALLVWFSLLALHETYSLCIFSLNSFPVKDSSFFEKKRA